MTVANQTIKSIIDRILRLKEEQDVISADVRDVYAEAKSNGFDKTALGQVVSYIRKRAKDGDKFDETNALMQVYLDAYNGVGTVVASIDRAHAHEAESPSRSTTRSASLPPRPQVTTGETAADSCGSDDASSHLEAKSQGPSIDGAVLACGPQETFAPSEMPDIPSALDRRPKAIASV